MQKVFISILFLILNLISWGVEAGMLSNFQNYRGWKAFESHDYPKAQENFAKSLVENPKDPVAAYNLGNTYYRKGDFLKAAESFYKATEAQDPRLKEKAIYNLGNSFYKSGQWENAIKSYEEALKVEPKDEEARLNLEFVKKKLQEKQQQDKQNQQNQSQGGEGQDKQQGGKSGASENQKDPQSQQGQKTEDRSQESGDQKQGNNSKDQNQQKNQNSEQTQNQSVQNQNQDSKNQSNQAQNNQNQPSQDQNAQNSKQKSEQSQNEKGQDSKQAPEGKLELKNESKNQKEEATGTAQVKGGGGDTTHQEAEQWLGALQEDASRILKNQIQKKIGKARRVEKDW